PDLQRQHSARTKPRRRLGNQFPHQLVAAPAGEKCDLRIVQDFTRKSLLFLPWDVGKICDDDIEASFHIFQEIASQKADTVADEQPLGIFPSKPESIFRNIDRENVRLRQFRSQTQRDYAAACADICDAAARTLVRAALALFEV